MKIIQKKLQYTDDDKKYCECAKQKCTSTKFLNNAKCLKSCSHPVLNK
jgi:hypothetical protein